MVCGLRVFSTVPDRTPESEALLKQTEETLRAMKLHMVNYRLQILLLSMRNPVGYSDSTLYNQKEWSPRNIPSSTSRR
jgi:hypothetical protein